MRHGRPFIILAAVVISSLLQEKAVTQFVQQGDALSGTDAAGGAEQRSVSSLASSTNAAMVSAGAEVKITILYDNTAFTQGTTADWGFSCFIQGPNDTLLYDVGANGAILLKNADTLGIDISRAKKVFLSHDHFDHTGGIDSALAKAYGVPVYAGALFTPSVLNTITAAGGQLVPVTGPVEVSNGYYSTGELPSNIGAYEQSLIIDSDSGLVVVVGCSHPGIVEILRRLKAGLGRNLFAVFGGLHLLDLTQPEVEAIIQELRNLGVRKCGATHCTGDGPIQWISQAYGSDFLPMGVGRVIEFSASGLSLSSPVMWLTPSVVDFGQAELGGKQDTLTLVVENITPRALTISEFSNTSPAFELLDIPLLPTTVYSGTPLRARATFHPVDTETYIDTIRIISDDAMAPVRLIPVSGEGIVVDQASMNTLYALGGLADQGNLRIVDPVTGATQLVGPTGLAEIAGARVSPLTGEIIALAPTTSSTSVVRLSAAGNHYATMAKWAETGWKGMAFRTDTLYLTRLWALYSWDMKAPAPTLIKVFSRPYAFSGLAYRSTQDDFLASVGTTSETADSLYRIEPGTWTITAIGTLGVKPVQDIVFDDAQTLFGVLTPDTGESTLLRINTVTGVATTVGSMGAEGVMALAVRGVATSAEGAKPVPTKFRLLQNYPNPFNPSTTIRYELPRASHIMLKVYDVLGREVATLVNAVEEPGHRSLQWTPSGLGSGVYFYRLTTGDFVEMKKLMLLR